VDDPALERANEIDVFVDLSSTRLADLERSIRVWTLPERLGTTTRRLRGVVPPGQLAGVPTTLPSTWTFCEADSSIVPLGAAMADAGRSGVPLLVLLGPVDVGVEAIGVLRQCLERDPMFASAVPRVGCADRCCFLRLANHGVGGSDWLPRKVLADLPDSDILVEIAAPCLLLAPRVLANFAPVTEFEHVAAALLHYLAAARRSGFRAVLCNRALVGVDGFTCDTASPAPVPALSANDEALLSKLVPEFERGWREFRASSWERFEKLCTSTVDRTKPDARPSLLLDVRNIGPIYNGTTQAVLNTALALKALQPPWDVAVLASPQGAAFHGLERALAGWPIYTEWPDRVFTVALRPAQPWHIQEMIDLHAVALFNAYLMLDSIAWDIVYATTVQLEGTWQFLADHADALLFDSEFTRQRFIERFPSARRVPGLVTRYSFDPKEYVLPPAVGTRADEPFILVVGNNLEHKDVRRTVEALASGFPYHTIRALGATGWNSRLVVAQPSGELPELDIHRLYASASYVVFPSFYEGFGFPVLTALAYGRTVLARQSPLLGELAALADPRPAGGRLITFDRREELVDLLGRLMHGESVPEQPVGTGLRNNRPRRWLDVGRDIVAFLEPLLQRSSHRRWVEREHVVRQLIAYRN